MKYILLLISSLALGDFRKTESIREYIYDFSVSGGATNTLIDVSTAATGTALLPSNAVVSDVDFKVVTALTSSVDSSITFGNTTDTNGYLVATPRSSFTDNALFVGNGELVWDDTEDRRKLFLTDDTDDRNIGIMVTAGTPITAGKILIKVKYYTWGED